MPSLSLRRKRVTIYQFTARDPVDGVMRQSNRWGTRKVVENVLGGTVLEGTAVDVHPDEVQSDIPGLTIEGFVPRRA